MKKIYQFSSTNHSRFLSIEEKQSSIDEIVIRVTCEDDEFLLPFKVIEFKELCNLRDAQLIRRIEGMKISL